MHIIDDNSSARQSPDQIWRCHANLMSKAIIFGCFLGNATLQHICPSFGRCPSSFGEEKPHTGTPGTEQIFIWHFGAD